MRRISEASQRRLQLTLVQIQNLKLSNSLKRRNLKQMHKKTENIFFPCNLMSPFPDVPFLNLAGYVHQRTEIIMKLYQKVVLNLCVIYLFIYLILILQLHAFIPKILLVILLTVLPSILIILVWTVWCWINL